MKLSPFQGIIDQSIVTNKMLMNMNTNIGNLASEIKNAFKGNSVQKLNNDLTATKKPADDIVVLLDELQKELKACGNVDIAKSVEKFKQKLKASKSTAEDLMNSLNGKIKGKYNQETADYFDKQLFIGEQNEVFTFLQELQRELRDCGDIDTAKSVKKFEQQLHKTVSTSEEQIGKIKNKIDTLFSTEDGSNFLKALEPKQAEITIDTVIKQLQELQRQYASIGDTKSSNAVSEYLKQLKTDTIDFEGQLQSLKANLGICLGTEEVEKFEQSFRKAFEPPSETEQLTTKLKEVESQLRACGETTKANKMKEMLQQVEKETTDVKGSMVELRQYIEKTFGTEALKQFDKELKNIDKTTQKVSKKSNFGSSLKTALGIGTVALGIRKAVGFFKEATTESIDFVETQNLFNVSMGKTVDQYGNLDREASKYYTKAMSFQEKLSDKLKINIEESMEYQALFNAMSKSMGIGDEPSYKISENFTKLGYDLSSLYNIDPENAMQKLRAGLSGQTKPLRDLGLDITQQSLEPLLDELGIERSTKQLSQAEKMIARYIVVLRQASLAHGDFAKTMDSPANQLRIFNAQLTAFKRNTGNLWQGLLGNILPYVNAIMMVINELLKMIGKLFGFKVESQNISTDIGTDDLADDLGTATGKAKELKKQLMGFDEINNITIDKGSSGGSGGASVGGIDQRLLEAMKEYDNLMDKVKNKATDIRDKIMRWLGFTQVLNSETGELEWKLRKDIYPNILKIRDGAIAIGTALIGWKVASIAKNILGLAGHFGTAEKSGSGLLGMVSILSGKLGIEAGSLAGTTGIVGIGLVALAGYLVQTYNTSSNFRQGIQTVNKSLEELSSFIFGSVKNALTGLKDWLNSLVPEPVRQLIDSLRGRFK